jgi:hypothetical protein
LTTEIIVCRYEESKNSYRGLVKNLNERGYLEEIGVDGKITFDRFLSKFVQGFSLKPEGKRLLGRNRPGWEYYIRQVLK